MENDILNLTQYSQFSGCGAKLDIDTISKALCGLKQPQYPNLLEGFSNYEDAGLYQLDDDNVLVQTVDFFPAMVDDPYLFGRIAAANALSDIYSMGAKPISALALVCYPRELGISILKNMMQGGLDALIEANAPLLGGHSIKDAEPKLGYSVTGIVKKDKIWKNNNLTQGLSLLLTKPLGVGVVNTAQKAGLANNEDIKLAQNVMATLNKGAFDVLKNFKIKACTDITGFGLVGHLSEMILGNNLQIDIYFDKLPMISKNIKEYINMGLVPEATWSNKKARANMVLNFDDLTLFSKDIIFDPQTSGGLLVAIDKNDEQEILNKLENNGINAAIIGGTTSGEEGINIIV